MKRDKKKRNCRLTEKTMENMNYYLFVVRPVLAKEKKKYCDEFFFCWQQSKELCFQWQETLSDLLRIAMTMAAETLGCGERCSHRFMQHRYFCNIPPYINNLRTHRLTFSFEANELCSFSLSLVLILSVSRLKMIFNVGRCVCACIFFWCFYYCCESKVKTNCNKSPKNEKPHHPSLVRTRAELVQHDENGAFNGNNYNKNEANIQRKTNH